MKLKVVVLLMMIITLLVAACTPAAGPAVPEGPERPVSSDDPTPVPTDKPAGGEIIEGEATVESLEILVLESFPVQVHALVKGYLGDGCTTIGQITQTREGDTFKVTITTVRPADAICTMILVGFEESIPLDVHGLPAGTYTVDVNGVTATFTLEADNVLPGEVEEMPEAALKARLLLAQELGVDAETIAVREVTPVEWSNACLGVQAAGEMCAEVITPGYQVELEVEGAVYRFHTNSDGSHIRLAIGTQ